MTTIRGLDDPLSNLVASLVSGVLAPFVDGLRSTFLASVDVSNLANNAVCIVDGISNSLPDAGVLITFSDNVRTIVYLP